jgi:hypothetical protein
MFARCSAASLLLAMALAAGCSRPVDLKQALEVVDPTSGWFDAGIVDGKNKIVPSVTFRLRKQPDVDLSGVALIVQFRRLPLPGTSTDEEGDEVFIQRAEFKNGNETEPLTVRPETGYTGDPPQSRLDLLKHSQFRDVRARILARGTSSQWVEIGTIDVQRQLIVR